MGEAFSDLGEGIVSIVTSAISSDWGGLAKGIINTVKGTFEVGSSIIEGSSGAEGDAAANGDAAASSGSSAAEGAGEAAATGTEGAEAGAEA